MFPFANRCPAGPGWFAAPLAGPAHEATARASPERQPDSRLGRCAWLALAPRRLAPRRTAGRRRCRAYGARRNGLSPAGAARHSSAPRSLPAPGAEITAGGDQRLARLPPDLLQTRQGPAPAHGSTKPGPVAAKQGPASPRPAGRARSSRSARVAAPRQRTSPVLRPRQAPGRRAPASPSGNQICAPVAVLRCCTSARTALGTPSDLSKCVELARLELATPCLQTTGTPSAQVRTRRSPSQRVHPHVLSSRPVAVLSCCTSGAADGPLTGAQPQRGGGKLAAPAALR
jgi:hypothetical protein